MVNSAIAEEKAAAIKDLIARKVEEALPAVQTALVANALIRTPTVDEEYNELMAEDGGVAAVPRSGGRSADQDERIRMLKPEETYLHNAVANPLNTAIEGNVVNFGDPLFLNTCTTYQYVNKLRTGKDTYELVTHEVGSYFAAIIEGGQKLILPVFRLLNGHKYRLRPVDDDKDPGVDSMQKSFASHPIFAPFALLAAARDTLTTALSELKNGA